MSKRCIIGKSLLVAWSTTTMSTLAVADPSKCQQSVRWKLAEWVISWFFTYFPITAVVLVDGYRKETVLTWLVQFCLCRNILLRLCVKYMMTVMIGDGTLLYLKTFLGSRFPELSWSKMDWEGSLALIIQYTEVELKREFEKISALRLVEEPPPLVRSVHNVITRTFGAEADRNLSASV